MDTPNHIQGVQFTVQIQCSPSRYPSRSEECQNDYRDELYKCKKKTRKISGTGLTDGFRKEHQSMHRSIVLRACHGAEREVFNTG